MQEEREIEERVEQTGSSAMNGRQRLISLDALRGLVMLVMLVDHVRETVFLHQQVSDPVSADGVSVGLFLTRLLSGFCAPAFVLLAGTGAYLYGQKHSSAEVSRFLLTRGLFLVCLELFVIGPAWTGVFLPEKFYLQVIWCIGLSMIALAGIIHLPRACQWSLAIFLTVGHHFLDAIHASPADGWHSLWAILYQRDWITLFGIPARTSYPILPWIGVILMGYLVGSWFRTQINFEQRSRRLLRKRSF